jgi:hypothetical protein
MVNQLVEPIDGLVRWQSISTDVLDNSICGKRYAGDGGSAHRVRIHSAIWKSGIDKLGGESRKKVGFSSQRKNIMPKTARVQTVEKKNGEKENDEGSARRWFYPQDSGQLHWNIRISMSYW